ncbi:MAG: tetratricopeptide repeat protein [Planctomycetota bacterium]|nr:tetratricopeptide repeat protein [Planctomycetota bacterium]
MDVSKLVEKAREAAERRNYEYAIDLYLQACKLSPDSAAARRELRAVESRLSKEKGTSLWAKIKVVGLHAQVWTLFKMGKFDAAIEKAEEALKNDPSNIGVLMLLGKAALSANYKPTAVATFEDIKAMNAGGNPKQLTEAVRWLAHAYEADGKIKEAMDTWTLVLKYAPGDREGSVKIRDLSAKTMTAQIETSAASGERGAMARTTQTEEQKTAAARMDREKAVDIKTAEDLQAAIGDAKSDIQQRPDDPRLYAKLGDLYKLGNNYIDAKKAYETAREKDPNNYTWLFRLHDLEIWKMVNALRALLAKAKAGDAAAKAQQHKDHMALLEYRLTSFVAREKQYSTDTKIKYELGIVYDDLARAKKDRNLYDEAIKRFQVTFGDPKFRVESGLRMGLGFQAKGQYELALKRFDETLKPLELKNVAWKNLMYAKGDTLEKAGRRDEAKKVFLEIYEIDVSFRDIAKRVDDLTHSTADTSTSA